MVRAPADSLPVAWAWISGRRRRSKHIICMIRFTFEATPRDWESLCFRYHTCIYIQDFHISMPSESSILPHVDFMAFPLLLCPSTGSNRRISGLMGIGSWVHIGKVAESPRSTHTSFGSLDHWGRGCGVPELEKTLSATKSNLPQSFNFSLCSHFSESPCLKKPIETGHLLPPRQPNSF